MEREDTSLLRLAQAAFGAESVSDDGAENTAPPRAGLFSAEAESERERDTFRIAVAVASRGASGSVRSSSPDSGGSGVHHSVSVFLSLSRSPARSLARAMPLATAGCAAAAARSPARRAAASAPVGTRSRCPAGGRPGTGQRARTRACQGFGSSWNLDAPVASVAREQHARTPSPAARPARRSQGDKRGPLLTDILWSDPSSAAEQVRPREMCPAQSPPMPR